MIYFYGRVSRMKQVEGESLEVQFEKCRGYVKSVMKEDISRKFVERGVSGVKRFADRIKGKKLLEIVKDGDTIIGSKLDRLWRSSLDCLNTIELLKSKGVKVIVLDLQGEITSSNGFSRFFLTIISSFAEMERDRIRERIVEIKESQKRQGKYLGGRVKYGYKVIDGGFCVEDEKEQKIIDSIQVFTQEKMTLSQIQQKIEEQYKTTLNLVLIHRLQKRQLQEVV